MSLLLMRLLFRQSARVSFLSRQLERATFRLLTNFHLGKWAGTSPYKHTCKISSLTESETLHGSGTNNERNEHRIKTDGDLLGHHSAHQHSIAQKIFEAFSETKEDIKVLKILNGQGHITANKPVISMIYFVAHTWPLCCAQILVDGVRPQ